MLWRKNLVLFSLLVCLVFSLCPLSRVYSAEALVSVPIKNLEELRLITEKQEQRLELLATLLTELETKSAEQEQSLKIALDSINQLKTEREHAQNLLKCSELIIAKQNSSLQSLSEELKKERQAQTLETIKYTALGVGVGYLFGKLQ